MKRLWHYKNMRFGVIFCILLFLFFFGLGIFISFNSISLYLQYDISYDDLFYEELTFNRYETKTYVSGVRSIGYKYEIYFEEYEKPFEINTITNKKLDKTSLANLAENDIIKVYYRKDLAKKYEYEICEIRHSSTILLSLSDYIKLNKNNQIVGMFLGPIYIIGSLFLISKFAIMLKNLNPKVDLGELKIKSTLYENEICIYQSINTCSLVINDKIIDQYRGTTIWDCTLKGKLWTNSKKISIKAKIENGNLQLYGDDNLLVTKFMGFN